MTCFAVVCGRLFVVSRVVLVKDKDANVKGRDPRRRVAGVRADVSTAGNPEPKVLLEQLFYVVVCFIVEVVVFVLRGALDLGNGFFFSHVFFTQSQSSFFLQAVLPWSEHGFGPAAGRERGRERDGVQK